MSAKSWQRPLLIFRKTCPPWNTISPAIWCNLHRMVWAWCRCHEGARVFKRNNRKRLYATMQILKKMALASHCPQGILSIPKPIFSSFIRFSLWSPCWLCHVTTSSADSILLVTIMVYFTLTSSWAKIVFLIGPADHNKMECFVLFIKWVVSAIEPFLYSARSSWISPL